MGKDNWIDKWIHTEDNDLRSLVGMPNYDYDIASKILSERIDVHPSDVILDVCCGTGIMTQKIAPLCKCIYGLDFSEKLIAVAKENNRFPNVEYYYGNALSCQETFDKILFDKIFCFASLQYFSFKTGGKLISALGKILNKNGTLYFSEIPDRRKLYFLYDTWSQRMLLKKSQLLYRLKLQPWTDSLGYWWHPDEIIKICKRNSFDFKIYDVNLQPVKKEKKRYRMDILIRKIT
jgi:2-polyprenyl-3-methyl-5-hydroxy-6-metoxy-1,4-benzoquinol methylase